MVIESDLRGGGSVLPSLALTVIQIGAERHLPRVSVHVQRQTVGGLLEADQRLPLTLLALQMLGLHT